MSFLNKFYDLRNTFDFFLRSQFRWGYSVQGEKDVPSMDKRFQAELDDFLRKFSWGAVLKGKPWRNSPVIVDIGARNFTSATVLEKLFAELDAIPEIHGIEMDAYRRLSNFHTRKDYGDYYAKQISRGHYHPIDFLKFETPVHIALLLNPFVTVDPLLDWGLPGRALKPEQIFRHTFNLLKDQNGVCLLSCPCPDEFAVALRFADKVGFVRGQTAEWHPKKDGAQGQPRYGILLKTSSR